jgi:hypothetical protein
MPKYASLYEFKFVINPENHGLVQAGIALGRSTYGSPTL